MTTTEKYLNTKGGYVSLGFRTEKKPAAKFKAHKLEKITFGVFRAGIDYANLSEVKESIAKGERGEVQELPWGEWKKFPYVITHKDQDYLRLYPSNGKNHKVKSAYFVDGKRVTKEAFADFLTPSAKRDLLQGKELSCFTVKAHNVFFKDSALTSQAKQLVEEAV